MNARRKPRYFWRYLNTEVIRLMTRDELEEALTERGIAFDGYDYSDQLRDRLMEHEAGAAR